MEAFKSYTLFFQKMEKMFRKVSIPVVLSRRESGTAYRIWIFLYLNQDLWFSPKEISKHLGIPLTTVHVTLRRLREYPEIIAEKEKPWRGRPKTKYKFGKIEYDFKV
ncbi:MAG: hypothetical protein QXX41_00035 [Nitrososphaerota archaeon]